MKNFKSSIIKFRIDFKPELPTKLNFSNNPQTAQEARYALYSSNES